MGISGIDIAEEEIDFDARIECAGTARPKRGWTEAAMVRCAKPSDEARASAAKVETDAPPNGATTKALAAMLAKIDRGEVLAASSRRWLMTTLEGTRTGPTRLRAGVPKAAPLAHKTGTGPTIGGVNVATNDIGTITLPDGSPLAIAVLTAGRRADSAACNRTIADAARAAWEAFVE